MIKMGLCKRAEILVNEIKNFDNIIDKDIVIGDETSKSILHMKTHSLISRAENLKEEICE